MPAVPAVALFSLIVGAIFCASVSCIGSAQNVSGDDSEAQIRIGVLGLFHPMQLTVSARPGSALILNVGEQAMVLEKSSGADSATVSISDREVVVTEGSLIARASKVTVAGRKNEPVDFVLAVPEKIRRRYHGKLEIRPSAGRLMAIVTMDPETAVASVVAAESMPGTPFEALKAQAVATRSYLLASRGRHRDFDFCDTTHCQFLREPPAPGSAVAKVVSATRDFVLAYNSLPIPAMYTRSCSGRTRTPAELGLPSALYPYYSVECKYCREHAVHWSSRISADDAATLRDSDESERLNIDRRLGWAAVPSNNFVARKDHDQILLEGTGEGHGIGLCQSGAKAMAEEGADFRQILSHYYPNTTIIPWFSSKSLWPVRPYEIHERP